MLSEHQTSTPQWQEAGRQETHRTTEEDADELEMSLQCFQVLVVWQLYAFTNCLPPPDCLGSFPNCGAGHLSVSLLRGTIDAWSGPWYI